MQEFEGSVAQGAADDARQDVVSDGTGGVALSGVLGRDRALELGAAEPGGPDGDGDAWTAHSARTQREIDRALGQRLAAQRAKYAHASEVYGYAREAFGTADVSEIRKRLSQASPKATPSAEDARAWARAAGVEAEMIARENGDPGFVREMYTRGTEVSRRIFAGESPADVYAATRGSRQSIYAARPAPARVPQTPASAGGGAPDPSRLTDEDVRRIDAQLQKGTKVRV